MVAKHKSVEDAYKLLRIYFGKLGNYIEYHKPYPGLTNDEVNILLDETQRWLEEHKEYNIRECHGCDRNAEFATRLVFKDATKRSGPGPGPDSCREHLGTICSTLMSESLLIEIAEIESPEKERSNDHSR